MVPACWGAMRKMRTRKAETVSAKLSAAKAEPKKPASVMPIWMVERNWVGVSMMRSIFFARLSPSEARARTFFSFREITAISVAAKKALHKINTICRSNCFNIVQKNLHRYVCFFEIRSGRSPWRHRRITVNIRNRIAASGKHTGITGSSDGGFPQLRGSGSTKPSPFRKIIQYIILMDRRRKSRGDL